MKKAIKKAISILLVAVMVFGAAPLAGFVGLDLPDIPSLFDTKADAATSGYYTYTVSKGEATITAVDTSISGYVTVPSKLGGYPVTSIGNEAFYCCHRLISILLPDSITSIGESAFLWCDSLTSVTIPDSVTSIEQDAFGYCKALTDITLPNSVTNISGSTFRGCQALTSITIPDSVASIGINAFNSCTSLANITIPDSITRIDYWAFSGCSSLVSITIPCSVIIIGNYVFDGCSSLASIIVDESNSFYSSDNYGVLFNKNKTKLIKYPVGNSRITYTIPNSVTEIEDKAFAFCQNLTSIIVEDGNNCYSNDSCGVLFDKNKTTLIQYPVGNLRTSYVIPNRVKCIDSYSFSGCKSLMSITIPNSVIDIFNSAFENCVLLESIIIPNRVTCMGSHAFKGCSSLTSIAIPDGVTSIGESVFYGCTSLTSVTIPDSVTSIGGYSFGNCKSLASITIPDSVTSIWGSTFFGCESLTSITIPDSVTRMEGHTFQNCKNLKSVTLSNRLTSIGDYEFGGCESLVNIVIPDSVTSIGNNAFYYCNSLEYIHIPSRTTSIADDNIRDIYICSNTEKCYAKTYADANGIEFRVCNGHSSNEKPENYIAGTMKNLGITYEYEYSDEFFENSSYEYNHDMATMSICLAISAMVEKGSYNGEEPESAKKLMEEIGYSNPTPYNYDKEPEQDSIACIIGSKNIPETDETVIAIVIRGAGYGNEWAGNFNLGDSKTHKGFKRAKNKVMSYLCSFIEENKETFNGSVKYWVTGFSRSAATANLVAAELDEIAENPELSFGEWWSGYKTIAELNYEPSDVYAYTFETPMNTTSDDSSDNLYKNIFNIINRNDLVPRVAPSEWGYDRFGIDCMLPSAEKTDNYKDFKDRMSESYEIITDGLTYEEEFQYFEIYKNWDVWYSPILEMRENKSMYQSAFLDEFVGILAYDIIDSRETYIDKYEASVMELAEFLMGTKGYEWNFNLNDFLENLGESIKDKWLSLAFDAFTGSYLKGVVSTALSAACGNVDLSASDIYDVLDELDGIFEGLASNFDTTYTLIVNAVKTVPTTEKPNGESRLFYTHNPAVCLAWMDAIDGELIEVEFSNIKMFEDNVYRILAKLPSIPSNIKKLEEKVDYILNNPSYSLTLEERNVLEQYKQESQITRTYRKVIFNCPVNISVYDKNGALRASIVDDIVQYVPDGYISTYINPDGEKVFCLPNDGEYAFEITGTDSGMLNCSVVDFDADLRQNITGSNYYNIPVENGTQITGSLKARTTEELKSQSRFGFANGTDIPVSEVIDYTTEDEYTVTVESDSETGNVIGGGKYYIGEFAKVLAFSGENEYFAGWFINGKCVSYEPEYRFMVTSNCTLTAKFYPSKEWKLDIDNSRSIIYKGEFVLTPIISPAPVNAKIVYSSSDTSVATVDDNGNVTAVGTGNAIITAKIEGTEIYDQCEVNVSYAWWQWIIRILLLGFLWY